MTVAVAESSEHRAISGWQVAWAVLIVLSTVVYLLGDRIAWANVYPPEWELPLAQSIKTAEVVAFDDLGPEAIRKLEVEDLPVIVINDTKGNDLYKENVKKYKRD